MAFTIDPPPRFAPTPQWKAYLEQLKALPDQHDPIVQAEIRDAQSVIARAAG